MNETMRFPGSVLAVVVLAMAVLALLVFVSGCEREPAAQQQSQQAPMHEHVSADQPQVEAVAVEQTTCPVMGGAINKTVFVEYKGKRVYFCCKGCDKTFQANPEQYIAKLPQFQH